MGVSALRLSKKFNPAGTDINPDFGIKGTQEKIHAIFSDSRISAGFPNYGKLCGLG